MQVIQTALLVLLLCLLPLGELVRFQTNNGINISLLDLTAGGIFLLVCIQYLKNRSYGKLSLSKPILLFISLCFLSLLVNIYWLTPFQFFVSFLYFARLVSYMCVYFFIARLKKKQIPFLLKGMLISGCFVVLFGFLQYFLYPNLKNLYYLGWDEHYLRLFSTFFDPNFAGIFLVLFFLFTLTFTFMKLKEKRLLPTILYGTLSICTCIAVFLTYSRAAFLALLGGLLLSLFTKDNKKYLITGGIVSLFFILFLLFLTNVPTEGAHMLRIPSSKARLEYARHALIIFSEHPILGVGFNTYRYAQYRHGFLDVSSWEVSHAAAGTDDSFLFILVTTGLLGFAIFCYLLWNIFILIVQKKTVFSLLVASSFLALLIDSIFINSLFYPATLLWIMMLLGITENT